MNPEFVAEIEAWIADDPSDVDRSTLRALLEDGDDVELRRRFAAPLRFGTAGLRGPVMAGPAGMNRLTVRRATQGVVAWLKEIDVDPARGIVVGRDARRGSEEFNDEVVGVLLGAGVVVHEMPRPLPTPFVAYAVKSLGAAAGIMITASHNPPDDNGFKLYGPDGTQIVPPNDEIVERHAKAGSRPTLAARSSALHHVIGSSLFDEYRRHFVGRFGVAASSAFPITYTPLHGVGGESMLELFSSAGFTNVTPVAAQFEPDAAFPTLAFPNPEEPGALDLAMATADASASSLVLANDPDADRLGVAVRSPSGWRTLRGDEVGWLLASKLLGEPMSEHDVVATTIVSSSMLALMARAANVRFVTTLTGFKWIARAAGEGVLRFGYEEALGYAVDPDVADKDGMSAALAIAQLAHELDQRDASLLDRLDEIEARFGVHAGSQLSIRANGPDAMSRITAAVERMRTSPPTELGDTDLSIAVSDVVDLSQGWRGLRATDGLLLELGTTGRVVVRPSGTEPKLKAYIEVVLPPSDADSLADDRRRAHALVTAVRQRLEGLLQL